ncbi:MAG: CHAT domain-containing tetratricopeptide repeat protein [Candidatus Eisenbacteria bacterium]
MGAWFASASLSGLALLFSAQGAAAQVWARLDVPDSTRVTTIASLGNGYEAAWNALWVSALRAGPAGEGARWWALARATARSEPEARGSHIASDALALAARWTPTDRRRRVHAAERESLAIAAQGSREFTAADTLFADAFADYQALREQRRSAWVLGSRGVVAFLSGRYEDAERHYQRALVARRALGDERMIGATLNALGSTNIQLERYSVARPFLLEARAVRMRTREQAALGATLNGLGLVFRETGEPDSASVAFESALQLTSAAGDSARAGEAMLNLAKQLESQGELERAEGLASRALAIFVGNGDARLETTARLNRASVRTALGRYAEAAADARAGLDAARTARNPGGVCEAHFHEARVWLIAEDPVRARAPLAAALALADSLENPPLQARVGSLRPLAARQEGDIHSAGVLAEAMYEAALETGQPELAWSAASLLGSLAFDAGDFAASDSAFTRALRAASGLGRAREALSLSNLGGLWSRMNRLPDARAALERAEREARAAHALELEWVARLALGDVAERSGDIEGALASYREVAARLDTLRVRQGDERASLSVFGRGVFAYEALVHLLGKLDATQPDRGRAAEAFDWAERARARALLDLLARTESGGSPPRPLRLTQVQARLPDARTALLAYSLGDSSSSLWVVRRDRWKRVTLPTRSKLRTRVETLRRLWAKPDPSESDRTRAAKLGAELSAQILDPAAPLLAGVQHLVILPDGMLWTLPFEALSFAGQRGPLAGRFEVSYLPSSALLGVPSAARAKQSVALGDARYGDAPVAAGLPLAALPGTAGEVATLEALSPKGSLTRITGAGADRTALLAATHAPLRVLHLATHGDALVAEPERSGLWLAADSSGAPTRLEARDILAQPVSAELVTLSACGSGLGQVVRGEGVLGLTRAFLAAGSGSVVVSLWDVSDTSTERLMRRFYSELLLKHRSRAASLRDAKRGLIDDPVTAWPFHWASFVLVGDAGTL